MKATDFFQSKYLRKEDIHGPVTLTIAHVRGEMIDSDNGKETKAVMTFTDGRFKPMIVNKGNWLAMSETYGDDSDFWHGKPVEVYVDPSVMFQGKRVGGLRLRAPSGAAPTTHAPTWATFADAVAAAAPHGITRDALIAGLKARGANGWMADRDGPFVAQLIRDAQALRQRQPGDEFEPAKPDEIPW